MDTMTINRSGLSEQITVANAIMDYAVGKFVGFKVPANIADAFIAAEKLAAEWSNLTDADWL